MITSVSFSALVTIQMARRGAMVAMHLSVGPMCLTMVKYPGAYTTKIMNLTHVNTPNLFGPIFFVDLFVLCSIPRLNSVFTLACRPVSDARRPIQNKAQQKCDISLFWLHSVLFV